MSTNHQPPSRPDTFTVMAVSHELGLNYTFVEDQLIHVIDNGGTPADYIGDACRSLAEDYEPGLFIHNHKDNTP